MAWVSTSHTHTHIPIGQHTHTPISIVLNKQRRYDMRHEMLTQRALFAIVPIQKGAR